MRMCHIANEWAELDKKNSQSTGVEVVHAAGMTHQQAAIREHWLPALAIH
jgi:hypothetical protein